MDRRGRRAVWDEADLLPMMNEQERPSRVLVCSAPPPSQRGFRPDSREYCAANRRNICAEVGAVIDGGNRVPWFHAEGARQGGRTPLYAYLTRAVGKGRKSGKVAKYKFFIECPERDSRRFLEELNRSLKHYILQICLDPQTGVTHNAFVFGVNGQAATVAEKNVVEVQLRGFDKHALDAVLRPEELREGDEELVPLEFKALGFFHGLLQQYESNLPHVLESKALWEAFVHPGGVQEKEPPRQSRAPVSAPVSAPVPPAPRERERESEQPNRQADGGNERGRAIVDKLRRLGIVLRWDTLVQTAGGAPIGLAQVAEALHRGNHVQSRAEAFDKYLRPGCPAYVSASAFSSRSTGGGRDGPQSRGGPSSSSSRPPNSHLHSQRGHRSAPASLRPLLPLEEIDRSVVPLNKDQHDAIASIRTPLTLIQGPPGTGKSTTLFHIIQQRVPPGKQVLVTSYTNQACSSVCEKLGLMHTNLRTRPGMDDGRPDPFNIVVVGNPARLGEAALPFHIDRLAMRMIQEDSGGGVGGGGHYGNSQYHGGGGGGRDFRDHKKIKAYRAHLLAHCSVVIMTISTVLLSGTTVFNKMRDGKVFMCIVDEAASVAEECMPSLLLADPEYLVLIGDHSQLRPFTHVSMPRHEEEQVMRSFFERAIEDGVPVNTLLTQYRMPAQLGGLVSELFYGGRLLHHKGDDWGAVEVISHSSYEEGAYKRGRFGDEDSATSSGAVAYNNPDSGPSHWNRAECNLVADRFHALCREQPGSSIMVISFYAKQVTELRRMLQLDARLHRVVSVDSCQGSEADIVILSCVRGNERGDLGFTTNPNRLNVAVSRAKEKCVFVWNDETLRGNKLWAQVVDYCEGVAREARNHPRSERKKLKPASTHFQSQSQSQSQSRYEHESYGGGYGNPTSSSSSASSAVLRPPPGPPPMLAPPPGPAPSLVPPTASALHAAPPSVPVAAPRRSRWSTQPPVAPSSSGSSSSSSSSMAALEQQQGLKRNRDAAS